MSAATAIAPDLEADLARAQSDYLAISRGRHLYQSWENWNTAEETAWEKLQALIARMPSDDVEASVDDSDELLAGSAS